MKLTLSNEELAAQADRMKVMVNALLALIGGNAGPRKGRPGQAASAARAKQAAAPKAAARQGPDPRQIIPLETEDFRDF